MHDLPPLLEVTDLAPRLGRTPDERHADRVALADAGMLVPKGIPGGVIGSVFNAQDGLRTRAQEHLAQGVNPLPDFRTRADRISHQLRLQPKWTLETPATQLDLPDT